QFRFTAKLHQRFTHERPEPFPHQDIENALDGLEPLREAGRLTTLLAQFPWSMRDEPAERRCLAALAQACRRYALVAEFRHDSWLQEDALKFIQSLGIGFCNIDQPLHQHSIPPTELVLSPIAYVRLHGRNHARWFDHEQAHERYDYLYTERELD